MFNFFQHLKIEKKKTKTKSNIVNFEINCSDMIITELIDQDQ
jgi:hypothetical protein